jgi:hypothetical protein
VGRSENGRRFGAVALIAILGAGTRLAAAQDVEGRLTEMEKRIGSLQGEVERRAARERELEGKVGALETRLAERDAAEETKLKDLEDRLTGRGAAIEEAVRRLEGIERSPAAASRLRVGGYFDFELRDDHATDRVTFDQHRFVLKFDGDVNDVIAFRSEVEFEGGGSGASFLTDNYVAVEYAELHFKFDRAVNLRAGALLMPFGRFNALHDSPLQDLTDRPFVEQYVVPTTWTEAGVGLYGGFDLGGARLDYDFVVSNGLDQGFSSTAGGGLRDARSSFRKDNNDQKQVAGRVGLSPDLEFLDGANFGASGLLGRYDNLGRHEVSLFGLDAFLKKGPFEVLGEVVWGDLERDAAQIMAGAPGGLSGWYAEGRFHFFPDAWRGANPWFGEEATFTLVFRAESVDTDDSATAIDFATRGNALRDDVERYTVGLNFRPIEKTVLKIEYQFLLEPGGFGADNDRFVVSFATSF